MTVTLTLSISIPFSSIPFLLYLLFDIHSRHNTYSLAAVARGWWPEVLARAAGHQLKRWNFNLVRDTCGQAVTVQNLASDCPL